MEDHRVDNFFLMESPMQPLIITATYLLVVLKIGPYLMTKTQRFSLIPVITVYNVLQIIFNIYLFVKAMKVVTHFNIWCSPSDPNDSEMALYIIRLDQMFMLLKMLDLVETVFFVMRKKPEQVSFLHVFHHVGVVWVVWISCRHFPDQGAMAAMLNTFVHTFMYVYYLQSSRGRIRNKFWKKCLTSLQMGHQVVAFVIYLLPIVNRECSYPKMYLGFILGYLIVVFCLFLKFYKDNYYRTKKE